MENMLLTSILSFFQNRFKKVIANGCLTLSRTIILDSSKFKDFAEDNFKFDENDSKFSERVENAMGKEEIAQYEQFLLFSQCFQKTCTADT